MKSLLMLGAIASLFIPIFGKVIPGLQWRHETFITYGLPLALATTVLALFYSFKQRQTTISLPKQLAWIYMFFAYIITLWLFKTALAGVSLYTLSVLRSKLAGPLYGLCFLIIMSAASTGPSKQFSLLTRSLTFCFLTQVALSAYESWNGEWLGRYEIYIFSNYDGRDVLEILGSGITDRFGFVIPFTGQIGQHNAFGNMLALYNCIFLFAFCKAHPARRSYLWGLILTVVIFAAVFNGTRTAIIAIIISDFIVLRSYFVAKRHLIGLGMHAAIFLFIGAVLYQSEEAILGFIAKGESTFLNRVDLWDTVIVDSQRLFGEINGILFGGTIDDLSRLAMGWRTAAIGSFENQYISLFIDSGVIGLFLFLAAFVASPALFARRSPNEYRALSFGFICTTLICGITLDMHLHFTSMPLIVIFCHRLHLECKSLRRVPEKRTVRHSSHTGIALQEHV